MRDLTQSELQRWYEAVRPDDKLKLAIELKIVELDGNRFVRRNNLKRTIDEMPKAHRAAIHFRDRECAYCGSSGTLQVDHLIPFSAWPENLIWLANTSSNLVSACESCNAEKSNRLFGDNEFDSLFPFKSCRPIAMACVNCDKNPCDSCDTIGVWCYVCQQGARSSLCRLPKMICRGN